MPDIDPSEVEARLGRLTEVCRENGLRMTHQRLEVFREVASTGEHPDADTIFRRVRKRLTTISHDTVYRTLASLEEMGLVSRVDPIGGRARYDANGDTHHHFICTKCGSISDIYLNDEPTLPDGIEALGSAESLHVQVRGVCHTCNPTMRNKP
ncbi:Transcriptional regulator PerR [Pontiella desulfatans]|uniref:Transcriptional regulator PerR n=1 Tax=Pontiella desulfatans TaxID=2750659 RepID=A0A6C2UEM0_PONDE|nr:Fur family transcriptional regulator [Pontiella desulfatans]VGO17814.1 Transcriptional regulator PerR [Pontiella desulfatans]